MQAPSPLSTSADDLCLPVHRVDKRDVPYVPSDEPVVEAMLRFANVTENDVLYDLGCGDGRIVLAAARRGARAVGVDIDLQRIRESTDHCREIGMGHRARFVRGSFFDIDLSDASVVTLYLLPSINLKLRPKLLFELRPGARVISNNFDMGDWKPDVRFDIHYRTLYQWIIPAWVQGTWDCVIRQPGRRRRMKLSLHRRYQFVHGVAQLERKQWPLIDGRLVGEVLSFRIPDPEQPQRSIHFTARYDGRTLRGSAKPQGLDGASMPWGGLRCDP